MKTHVCAQVFVGNTAEESGVFERVVLVVRYLFRFCVESCLLYLILCLIGNLLCSVKYCVVAPQCNL